MSFNQSNFSFFQSINSNNHSNNTTTNAYNPPHQVFAFALAGGLLMGGIVWLIASCLKTTTCCDLDEYNASVPFIPLSVDDGNDHSTTKAALT